MSLTEEEIEEIAEPFVEWLGDTHGQRERGLPLSLVANFARAIEAKVRAEHIGAERKKRVGVDWLNGIKTVKEVREENEV